MVGQETTQRAENIRVSPSKRFFVSMLTRDIELLDAILDLIDNCIDGIHRTIAGAQDEASDLPFKNFWANLKISPESFCIEDNCGGIPLDIAKSSAFNLGRTDDDGIPGTIGMYGIGMKRAIFKLGRDATVTSQNGDDIYEVRIDRQWMESEDDWNLPLAHIHDAQSLSGGTRIEVRSLQQEVASRFNSEDDNFVDNLIARVGEVYAIILSKGFRLIVNDHEIQPHEFSLLISTDKSQDQRIEPYVLTYSADSLDVTILAGLYRKLPVEEEVARSRGNQAEAGWTVVCNDRVVLYKDKTILTGWGEAGVPAFHGQFIAITGMVVMSADDPWALPLTTTKRGLDASSITYLRAKDHMREATKVFTSFTNRWKG